MTLDKKFIDQFVNVTVKAAIAASHLVGKNDKNAADQAAVDSMRNELNNLNIKGKIVTVEGRLEGNISTKILGKNGFGYDPIFKPLNKKITFGQMAKIKKINMLLQ